jgi:hypothetical protein
MFTLLRPGRALSKPGNGAAVPQFFILHSPFCISGAFSFDPYQ